MNIYNGDYRKLMLLPILLLIVSILFIPNIKMGIDFQGGTIISLYTDNPVDVDTLESNLLSKGLTPRVVKQVQSQIGNIVEVEIEQDDKLNRAEELRGLFYSNYDRFLIVTDKINSNLINTNPAGYEAYEEEYETLVPVMNSILQEITQLAESSEQYDVDNDLEYDDADDLDNIFDNSYNFVKKEYTHKISSAITFDYNSITIKTVSPSLGLKFIERATTAIVWALVLSMILVFIVFRKFATSVIVFSGALADGIIVLGAMGFLGIELSLASFAALLMMMGFSLDTDMLLTMRLIKQRKGNLQESAWHALTTGVMMSGSDLIAFGVLLIVGYFTHLTTYYNIASVAVIGLVGDMIATWLFNAPLIMMLLERKR